MVSRLVRPVRKLVEALVRCHTPREMAAGFAIGMVLGLVPKGNLIALSLVVLLFSLRVNKGIALVAAVAFTWAGAVLDPFAHKTGLWLLSLGSMQATYAAILQFPFGPWLKFNNTVVSGSLALGLYLAYPAYLLSYWAFSLFGPADPNHPTAAGPRLYLGEEIVERRAA